MYDTTVTLKPRSYGVPASLTKSYSEMDAKLQVSRPDQQHGRCHREPPRHGTHRDQDARRPQIQGPNLDGIQQLGQKIQQILEAFPR